MSTSTTHSTKKNAVVPKLRFTEFNEPLENIGFADVGKILIGLTHTPIYLQEGKPFLSSKNISAGYIDYENIQYISEEEFNGMSESTKPKKGDILFTRVGSNLGNPIVVEANIEFGIFVSLGAFRVNKRAFNYFMKYWMDSNYFWRQVEQKVAGGAKNNLNTGWLKEFKLNLPSIAEQQKIASFLSAVDEKIQQLTRKKELLEQYKKGVMQQLFSGKLRFKDENGKPYAKWEEKRLIEFDDLVQGDGDWILSENIGVNEKYSIIQLGNIGFGAFINKEMKTLSLENFLEVKGTLIKKGDLLLNRMVDDDKINVCLFDYVGDYVTSVDVCWIRSASGIVNQFLMYLLLVRSNQKALLSLSSGSGRVRISKKNLFERFTFKLPCLEEQQKIASFLTALDAKIESVAGQIAHTQTFKKGLLQQMFV